jgi:hypothetical protein
MFINLLKINEGIVNSDLKTYVIATAPSIIERLFPKYLFYKYFTFLLFIFVRSVESNGFFITHIELFEKKISLLEASLEFADLSMSKNVTFFSKKLQNIFVWHIQKRRPLSCMYITRNTACTVRP